MRLSSLQKFILEKCLEGKNNAESKRHFFVFYPAEEFKKNKKAIQDVLHKSIESLVAKDLVVAHGYKTAKKWHIKKVKLTSDGRRRAKEILKSRQKKLPIK
jgi:hypothetical protein